MKKFILFLALLAGGIAFGENNNINWDEDNSRSISDLMYMPEKGKFFLEGGFGYITQDGDISYESGGTTFDYSEVSRKAMFGAISLGYGMTNSLAFSIGGTYFLSDETKAKYKEASSLNGTTLTFESDGLADPDINIKYRVLNQNDFKINMDCYLKFSPKLINAKDSSSDRKGNEVRGGHEGKIGLEIGKKFKNFSFMGEASYDYFLKRKYVDLNDDHKHEKTGGNEFELGFSYKYNLTELFELVLGASYSIESDTKDTDLNDDSKNESEGDKTTMLLIGMNIIPIKDKFYLNALFGFMKMAETETNVSGTILTGEESEGEVFALQALYQF